MSKAKSIQKELPKVTPMQQHEINWQNVFNELCYEIFYNTEKGKQFLMLCEQRYFYQPVAHPGKEIAWAHFIEGRNEFVRSIRNGINLFMTQPLHKKNSKVKQVKESA